MTVSDGIGWVRTHAVETVLVTVILGAVLGFLLVWGTSASFQLGLEDHEKKQNVLSAWHGYTLINMTDYTRWYKFNIVCQVVLLVSTALTSIFASLTSADNLPWIKKWTILASFFTALITALYSTFHIRENIAHFIEVQTNINTIANEYRARIATEIDFHDAANRTQENFNKANRIGSDFMNRFDKILRHRMELYGEIGFPARANNAPAAPPSLQGQVGGSAAKP